ncbi:hypothetical protein, partial [Shouchella clausii]|uniref:hypothetical protein n=1 Tax=Shouchella clausii TaxID=79880 RepID=UPI0038627B6D
WTTCFLSPRTLFLFFIVQKSLSTVSGKPRLCRQAGKWILQAKKAFATMAKASKENFEKG